MKRLVVVFTTSMIFFVLPTLAQFDFIPINYGDVASGEITDEESSLFYVFEATAGEVISIVMVAEDEEALDTVLLLYSSEGILLTANNNTTNPAWGRLNSLIDRYVIPQTDVYIIEATRMEGTGEFMLTLIDGMESLFFERPDDWHFEQVGPNNFVTATDASLVEALNEGEMFMLAPDEQLISVFEYVPSADPADLEAVMDGFQIEFSGSTVYDDTVLGSFGGIQFAYSLATEDSGRQSLVYMVDLPELQDAVVVILSLVGDADAGKIVTDRVVETLTLSTGPATLEWEIGEGRSVENSGLTVALPEGWISEVDEVVLRIGTSQVAFSTLGGFEVLPPGEVNIDLIYVPAQNAESLDLVTSDIESFAASFLDFAGSIGSVQAYNTDQFIGAIAFIESNEFDPENLVVITTEVFDDYFIWSVKHGEGSVYAQLEPLVLEIITSVQFQGTTLYP